MHLVRWCCARTITMGSTMRLSLCVRRTLSRSSISKRPKPSAFSYRKHATHSSSLYNTPSRPRRRSSSWWVSFVGARCLRIWGRSRGLIKIGPSSMLRRCIWRWGTCMTWAMCIGTWSRRIFCSRRMGMWRCRTMGWRRIWNPMRRPTH